MDVRWRWGWALAGLLALGGCGVVDGGTGDGADAEPQEEPSQEVTRGGEEDAAESETRYDALTASWMATLRIPAEADATVDARTPDTPLGTGTRLTVDGSPERRAYVRFRLEGLRGRVTRATLRLQSKDAAADGPRVYAVPGAWDERTLTWNNAPVPSGTPVADLGAVGDNVWVEVDVTAAVRGDGDAAFALVSDAEDGTLFVSRDSSRYMEKPQLVVELAIDEPCEVGAAPPRVPGESCAYRGEGGGATAGWFAVGGSAQELVKALGAIGDDMVVAGNYDAPNGATASFGGAPLPGPVGFGVARLRADGTHAWSRGFSYRPTSGEGQMFARLIDASVSRSGNTVLMGSYEGEPDFGTGPLPPMPDVNWGLFLLQVGADGTPRWSRGFRAYWAPGHSYPRPLYPQAVATDAAGNITVVGVFWGAVDLGGGWLLSSSTGSENSQESGLFIARFSASGEHLWSRSLRDFRRGWLLREKKLVLAVDNSGEVVLGGSLMPGADLGGGPVQGFTSEVPFVARFSARGEFLWQRVLSGAHGFVEAVAVSGERVYLSGNFIYRFDFAGRQFAKDASFAPFLGALDRQGRDVWMRTLGYTSPNEEEQALAVDSGGNIVFTNRIGQSWSAGGGVLRAGRLVASYGPQGEHRWSRTLSVNLWESQLTRLGNGELVLGSRMSRGGTLEGEWYQPGSSNLVLLRLEP